MSSVILPLNRVCQHGSRLPWQDGPGSSDDVGLCIQLFEHIHPSPPPCLKEHRAQMKLGWVPGFGDQKVGQWESERGSCRLGTGASSSGGQSEGQFKEWQRTAAQSGQTYDPESSCWHHFYHYHQLILLVLQRSMGKRYSPLSVGQCLHLLCSVEVVKLCICWLVYCSTFSLTSHNCPL